MDTANNVDHIMQSELLTCYDTLRPGLGKDDDISSNNSVVGQLTYSNGLLQKLHETGDTQCKICHQDVLTPSSAIPVRLKECSHNKAFHLHCIREVAASMLTQVQMDSWISSQMSKLSETSTSTDIPAEQSTLPPNSDQPKPIMVRIPEGIRGGEKFRVMINGKSLEVTCPNMARPGMSVRVVLPPENSASQASPQRIINQTQYQNIAGVGTPSHSQVRLTHFSRIRPQNVSDTYQFFYQQPVKSVFTATGGEQMHLTNIMEYIQSEHFINYVTKFDIKEPTVKTNAHILSMNAVGTLLGAGRVQAMKQAFVEEGKRCAGMGDKYHIQIVFHGTSESNIRNILHNGLDPSLRRGQSLGQGEYFAANPALPLQYCGGGKKMLVFAVITCDSDLRGRDVIVVKDGARQLPIATLSFTGYEASALKSAGTFKANVARLLNDANEKERVAKECRSKERIIQLMLKNEYLAASDIYNKACDEKGMPPKLWSHEISAYVRDHIRDPETVEIYFPNLPPRPISTVHLDILNSEKCEEDAKAAKRKVESFSGIISSLNHFNASSQA